MSGKINKRVSLGLVVLVMMFSIQVTSGVSVDVTEKHAETSAELLEKLKMKDNRQSRCGQNSLCKMYGEEMKLNKKNSLKFIALVNTLSGRK